MAAQQSKGNFTRKQNSSDDLTIPFCIEFRNILLIWFLVAIFEAKVTQVKEKDACYVVL